MILIRCTAAECEAMAAVHAEAFPASWRWDEFEDLLDGQGIYGFLASTDDAAPQDRRPLGVILCRVAAGEMEVLNIGVAKSSLRRVVS